MSVTHDDVDAALRRVDLNLLVALDALLTEGSVTRAARRMGVTQSAMSHTLRRLRALFGDPLLVRVGGEMVPTPRAERLQEPVRAGLVALGRVVTGAAGFDPATAVRTFRMAAPDLFTALFVPPLLQAMQQSAPGVDVAAGNLTREFEGDLRTGELDIAIVPMTTVSSGPSQGELVQRTLFRDGFSVFVRADHPQRATLATAEGYAALDHVVVSPSGRGEGVVDAPLAAHGLTRRVRLRLPTFASAPAIVAGTDLVLTAPTSLAAVVPDSVAVLDPPVPLPDHGITAVWHPRFGSDPGHRWFREQVMQLQPWRPSAEPGGGDPVRSKEARPPRA